MMGIVLGAAANIACRCRWFHLYSGGSARGHVCAPKRAITYSLAIDRQRRGHAALIESIGEQPLLDLSMRLGEGTGAALGDASY